MYRSIFSFIIIAIHLKTPLYLRHKQMVIENHIQTDSEPLMVIPAKHHVDDWTIVDIDNWLNGNRFWDKLKTGEPGDEELQ